MKYRFISFIYILISFMVVFIGCEFFDALGDSQFKIDITYPDKKGLKLNLGSVVKIQWEYGAEENKQMVLELCNLQNCEIITEEDTVPNNGIYYWSISQYTTKGSYYLKISDNEYVEGIFDISENFDIEEKAFTIIDLDSPNSGYANQYDVILDLSTVSEDSMVRFANTEEELENTDFIPHQITLDWVLTGGEGNKTIYGEFKDETGNIQKTSATIILDLTDPQPVEFISQPRTPTSNNVIIWVWSENTETDLYKYQYKFNINGNDGTWTNTDTTNYNTETADEDTYRLYVRTMDLAGNLSTGISSVDIIIDKTPPDNISGINAVTSSTDSINLNWINPVDDFMAVMILKNAESSITDEPVEGVNYPTGTILENGSVVMLNSTNLQSHEDIGLDEKTTYYYNLCSISFI